MKFSRSGWQQGREYSMTDIKLPDTSNWGKKGLASEDPHLPAGLGERPPLSPEHDNANGDRRAVIGSILPILHGHPLATLEGWRCRGLRRDFGLESNLKNMIEQSLWRTHHHITLIPIKRNDLASPLLSFDGAVSRGAHPGYRARRSPNQEAHQQYCPHESHQWIIAGTEVSAKPSFSVPENSPDTTRNKSGQ
jgi:hypothetical protein